MMEKYDSVSYAVDRFLGPFTERRQCLMTGTDTALDQD